jgi:hypothetical protein
MLKKRTFKVVLVNENKGVGVDETKTADTIIQYDGKPVKVSFR